MSLERGAKMENLSGRISFRSEVTDCYRGQTNSLLIASIDDVCVGLLEFSVFENLPAISVISVSRDYRRRGVGSALVLLLQSQFPAQHIEWGLLTEVGERLHKSLSSMWMIDLSACRAENQIALLEREENQILNGLEDGMPCEDLVISRLNDITDEIFELRKYLSDEPRAKRILLAPAPSGVDASRLDFADDVRAQIEPPPAHTKSGNAFATPKSGNLSILCL